MTRGLPSVHQTVHPASRSDRRISSATDIILMLSPARKTRVCPMRAKPIGRPLDAGTTRLLPARHQVRSLRALVSHRTCSGAGHRNHSGTVSHNWLATDLLHASENFATAAILKDRFRK